MTTRIVIQLLLLPMVIVGVSVMFSLAWLLEAIDDLKPRAVPAA
jgi:hypothetical protein